VIPRRLELVAFGPFIEPQVVDLARVGAHGLFLIHGPTGSGKSMLLDALTFALFGETSGSDRDGADLVASLADGAEARVALEFEHAGQSYRIERTPRQRRRRKGREGFTDAAPTATLHRRGPDGTLTLLADGAAQATAAVRGLLKCDAVQFRQTVVLPQGQFRRVIEDDETRARTLADLFDTGRFGAVQGDLKRYAAHLRGRLQATLAELDALRARREVADADALAARLADADGTWATARRDADDADARHTAAVGARAEGAAWTERFAELAAAVAALEHLASAAAAVDGDRRRLAADRAARDAEPAVRAWRAAERALGERRQARSDAVARAAAAAGAAAAARQALADHEAGRPDRDAAAATVARLGPLEADVDRLAAARSEAARTSAAAAETERVAADLVAARADAEARAAAAELEVGRLEPLAAALPDARAAAGAARAALDAFDRLAATRRDLAAAAEAGGAVDADLEALWSPLGRALAARLRPGTPCPVCGGVDHPAALHEGDRAGALEAARLAIESAQAAALQRAQARARAEAAIEHELRGAGWTDADVPAREPLLAGEAAARARLADLERAAVDLAARRAERDDARRRADGLATSVDAARAAAAEARDAATRAAAHLEGLLGRLDADHHDPAAFRAALAAARGAVDAYDRAAEAVAGEAARAGQAEALAEAQRGAAEGEVDRAAARHEADRAEAEAALRDAGFRAPDGGADPGAQAAALLDPALRADAERRVQEHDAAVARHGARRDALAAATAGRTPPDLAALDAAVENARLERDATAARRDAARDERHALHADLTRWRALDLELGATEARQRTAQHLADLANGTAKGHTKLDLETYVLRRILGDVLQHANVHLARMTGGRYQLRLRDRSDDLRARGLELDVEDRHAGGARRRVATLSGGEGFQASLALALGLSEAAERTSGAVELGALFIDEGFGSLDGHALDGVVRILRELPATQRRMVGVITHVEELKRRIEAQLLVTRDGVGSRVELVG
jgi:DNA repair protein SbcC/Rad50